MKSFLKVSLFFLIFCLEQIATEKLACYYLPDTINWPGRGKFEVNNIDPHLCTHLLYFAFGSDENGSIAILDPSFDKDNIKKFNQLKNINPQLKTLAVIRIGFKIQDPAIRKRFAREAKKFVLKHGFNGILVNSVIVDKYNLRLLHDVKKEFAPAGLMLVAVVIPHDLIDQKTSHHIRKLSSFVDHIHLMTFNFHTYADDKLGLTAPLYAGPADHSVKEKQLNVDAAVNFWLKNGAPKEKLILGIPFFGISFIMANSKNNKPGAASVGPGEAGPYSKTTGFLGYNEFCINQKSWKRVWEAKQQAPYGINGNQWLSYEDVDSIGVIVKYANDKGLAGAVVMFINFDDFQNDCGHGKYPLLNKIKSDLRKSETSAIEDSEEMKSFIDETSQDLIDENVQSKCPEGFKYSGNLETCTKTSERNIIIRFIENYMQMSETNYSEV